MRHSEVVPSSLLNKTTFTKQMLSKTDTQTLRRANKLTPFKRNSSFPERKYQGQFHSQFEDENSESEEDRDVMRKEEEEETDKSKQPSTNNKNVMVPRGNPVAPAPAASHEYLESEETFTIDGKTSFRMNLDFLDSV